MKQINVRYDNDFNTILEFVKDTQAGKYCQKKPVVVDYTLQRVDIQEQSEIVDCEECQENTYLFGITS